MGPGPALGRFNPGGGFKPPVDISDAMRLPRVGAPPRGPGTPPQGDDGTMGIDDFPPSRPAPPQSRGNGGAGPNRGPGPRRLGTPNDVRELEDRLVAAESAAAAHASRLRNMERRMAIAEAARKEDSGGARGVTEALEQRVSNLQMENARANGLIVELKGRLDATESDVKESRAQAMRVEAAAQVATVAARDAFDQIQQRIGIEQGSDARRLDLLSAEIARITREIADARGEDAAKRQILEANIARVEGQKAVDNTSQQFIDVRQKLNQTELQVVALTEALQDERRLRSEAETRLDVAINRMAELNDAREGSMIRKFSAELDNARLELQRALSDEKEEAQTRDDHIVRDKDEQLAQWEKAAARERARNLEHQLILEKAVREEHDQRVHQMDALNKGLDRVNHEVTQALRDEMLTREARENKLRGQISQSVLKLHAANKDTRDKLTQERDEIHATLKTEIKSRMHHLALLERHMRDAQTDTKQTIRSVEVSLANRINATDQKVDIEMNMIQKLIARQSKLETDFARFTEDIVAAFENMQEDITVAAVSQALNTECDNVQAEYVTDTAADILEIVEAQDARDKANHEKLSRAVFGDDPENGGVGLLPRAQKTEADVARLQRQELRVRDDIDGINERHEELRAEVESAQCLHAVDVESIQAELDAGAADRAAIFDDVEHKVKEQIKRLREENVASMKTIEAGIDDKFVDFRTRFGRKLGALEYTTEEFQDFVVHQHLENEAIRIDAETYAEARLGAEQDKRLAALVDLKQHVAGIVADEANQRRLGDSDLRRALEDDIADLEDTAADAVRELREGLRNEISEPTRERVSSQGPGRRSRRREEPTRGGRSRPGGAGLGEHRGAEARGGDHARGARRRDAVSAGWRRGRQGEGWGRRQGGARVGD